MKTIYLILIVTLFLSCKKDKEDALLRAGGNYKTEQVTEQVYSAMNTSILVPAYSLGSNDFILVSITPLLGTDDFLYIDKNYNYYSVSGDNSIITRSNLDQLKKPADFKMSYLFHHSSPHSDVKPYKLLFEGSNGIIKDSIYTIEPVLNYQIDSVNYIIRFNETQLNCLYFLGRKL
jgi:hypothetical protein